MSQESSPKCKIFFPNPVQKKFIESRGLVDLFCSRMGEGKTTALVFSCFYHTLHNPGANWVIIRDTELNIKRTTFAEFMRWFGNFVVFDKQEFCVFWKPPLSGRVMFISAHTMKHSDRMQSLEIAGIGIDEAAPVAGVGGIPESVFDIGVGRCRQPGMKWYAYKVVCNNPPKNHWVYRRFIETPVEGFNVFQTKEPENTQNLPEGYYDRLKVFWAHRPDLIKRYVEGDYGVVFEGAPAVHCFRANKHILPHPLELDRSKEVIALWDAFFHPAMLICQMVNIDRRQKLYVHDEIFAAGIGVYELITTKLLPEYFGLRYRHIGDKSMTTRDQSRAFISDHANCAANIVTKLLGGSFTPGAVGVEQRLEAINIAFLEEDILISPKCENLIDALSGAWSVNDAYSKRKSHPHSDLGDALAYGCSVVFANKLLKRKLEQNDMERMKSFPAKIVGTPKYVFNKKSY